MSKFNDSAVQDVIHLGFIVAASQPRTARQCNFCTLLGSGDQAVICKLHDCQLGGQRLLRSLVQRWILLFLDKFIIGSQGISLSFVFLFYLVYYFACCNFLVKFVFVFVYLVHFSSHVIKIFQLYFPFQFYVNLIYLSVKQQPFFNVRTHRV